MYVTHFCILNCVHKLTEQHTKEQQDMGVILEDISNLDTEILESPVGTTQSKDSVALSLVDDSNELISKNLMPEEVTADEEKIENEENFNEYTAAIGIPG